MITTLLWGFGVILLVEGAIYIIAPSLIEQVLKILAGTSIQQRRMIGALMALAGSSLLYLIRFL
ncbi:lantibiotic dehydratase family protein [Paracoccaceae bacterium]|nr:lantibiotic dehydratase family protein [Paracoccaceae bacterium]